MKNSNKVNTEINKDVNGHKIPVYVIPSQVDEESIQEEDTNTKQNITKKKNKKRAIGSFFIYDIFFPQL